MEILHFKDLWDTESVVMNAIVLMLGECQISMANVPQGGIYPHVKLYCNELGNDNVMPL